MFTIKFEAVFGDEHERVEITQVHGYHEGGYHVNIGGYHQGQLFFRNGKWVFLGNERSKVLPEDVAILGEIIDEYRKKHEETR